MCPAPRALFQFCTSNPTTSSKGLVTNPPLRLPPKPPFLINASSSFGHDPQQRPQSPLDWPSSPFLLKRSNLLRLRAPVPQPHLTTAPARPGRLHERHAFRFHHVCPSHRRVVHRRDRGVAEKDASAEERRAAGGTGDDVELVERRGAVAQKVKGRSV